MPRQVMLIVNPAAGKTMKYEDVDRLLQYFTRSGDSVKLFKTKAAKEATAITKEYAHQFGVICCCGGDGTLNEVVNGLMTFPISQRPELMYLPTGTTNVMGGSLGLPLHRPVQALEQSLKGVPQRYDVGDFNGSHFIYLASFGIFTDVSYATAQNLKNIMGYLAYILQGIRSITEVVSYDIEVEWDGEPFSGSYIFGALSNATSIGGVFKYKQEDIRLDDGLMEAIFIKKPDTLIALQSEIHSLISGQYDERYIRFFRTSQLHVAADIPIPWCVDGEFGGNHSMSEMKDLRQAITIIHPKVISKSHEIK